MAKIDSISDLIPENVYVEICADLKDIFNSIQPRANDTSDVANNYWLRDHSARRSEPVYGNMTELIHHIVYQQIVNHDSNLSTTD